jgi:hypothetical protein
MRSRPTGLTRSGHRRRRWVPPVLVLGVAVRVTLKLAPSAAMTEGIASA